MSAEQNTKKRGITLKEFFKGTAFKCIMVLLAIVLVCGILLTICYALFNVSDEERLNRVINQIYGYEVEYETVDLDGKTTTNSYGTINSAYKILDDGNYLISASGTGGYYGKVTCWVVVEMEDDYTISGIGSVVYQSSNETYMNYIKDAAYDYFSESYDGKFYSVDTWKDNGLYGGASYSMTAIVNSVNAAMEFMQELLELSAAGGEA